jgi:hypothetical protein
MKISFRNNFTAIANAGEAADVSQTADNLRMETERMIRKMYPSATVTVRDVDEMRAKCDVLVIEGGEVVEDEDTANAILDRYMEVEMTDCWV